MKAIFGVAILIVSLAIVALLAKNDLASGGKVAARIERSSGQAAAIAGDGSPRPRAGHAGPGALAGAAAAEPTAAQVSTAVANELRERTAEAVRQGEQRLQEAER